MPLQKVFKPWLKINLGACPGSVLLAYNMNFCCYPAHKAKT